MIVAKVLIADDEPMVVQLLRLVLTRLGHTVLTANGGRAALSEFMDHRPEVSIVDINMPDMNGIDVVRGIRAVDLEAPVIVWSGAGRTLLEREAQDLGVTEFLKKDFSFNKLGQALRRAFKTRDIRRAVCPAERT
jgi:DNA-binding NtrC family response regulator